MTPPVGEHRLMMSSGEPWGRQEREDAAKDAAGVAKSAKDTHPVGGWTKKQPRSTGTRW